MTDVLDRVLDVVARQASEWRAEADRVGSSVPRGQTAGDLRMMAEGADALFARLKGLRPEQATAGVWCMPFRARCESPEVCRSGGCERGRGRAEKAAVCAGPPFA